jgi:hypothetical protein
MEMARIGSHYRPQTTYIGNLGEDWIMEDEIKQTFFSFILALDIKNIIATRLKITTDIYLTKISVQNIPK